MSLKRQLLKANGQEVLGQPGTCHSRTTTYPILKGKLFFCLKASYIIDIYSDSEELKVKEETGATIRCFPFEQPEGAKKCLMTGNPAEEVAIFAKSY